MSKTTGVLVLFVAFLLFISLIGLGFYEYYVHYQYENKVGSYFENAVNMNTPDKMLEQVNKGKQGMINEGLVSSDYGAIWFKKPSNSMEMQYSHIDSIIERIKAVQEWKDKSYSNTSTSSENMGDVYEQKMTNLRKFIAEDLNEDASRSDWIAEDTWLIKKHLIIYLNALIIIPLFLVMVGLAWLGGWLIYDARYDKEEDDDEQF